MFQSSLFYDSKKWVIIVTSSIDESLREFKNRKSGFIQSGDNFIEKNLIIQHSWTKIEGVIATRSFTDYQIVRKLSIWFFTHFFRPKCSKLKARERLWVLGSLDFLIRLEISWPKKYLIFSLLQNFFPIKKLSLYSSKV